MTTPNILKDLNWRYATKDFDPAKKISDTDFETLQEALRLSPSSFGLQPWFFLNVSNQETRQKLLPHSWNQTQVVTASHLIVLCRPLEMTEKHVDSFLQTTAQTRDIPRSSLEGYEAMLKNFLKDRTAEQLQIWMEKQIYIALGTLLTTCANLNIDACPMEGFDPTAYNDILNLTSQNKHTVVVCPVGYRSEQDKYAALKKVRFEKERVWGEV